MIEVNKVAFVKTTDEPVFVLSLGSKLLRDITEGFVQSDEYIPVAFVRRPIQTEQGVLHVVNMFQVAELHTLEEKLESDMQFSKYAEKLRDKLRSDREPALSAVPKELLPN